MIKNSYLITGGTGSFGKAFLKNLLVSKKIGRIVIFSRDELKQSEIQAIYPKEKYPFLRYFWETLEIWIDLILQLRA